MNIVLGIDIGGTQTKIGLVNSKGEILAFDEFKTEGLKPFDDFLARLSTRIRLLLKHSDTKYQILGIGAGAPNANNLTGTMEKPHNFKWGFDVPLAEGLRQEFNVPVEITNDANAAAVGELKFGVAKGRKNFIILTLGTGLGGGIVVNGALLNGAHGMAGEIGHVNIKPNGRLCKCGLDGCLEAYVSVTGVKRTVFKFMAEWAVDSPLRSLSFDDMTGEMIAEAALNGDAIAIKAFNYTGDILGSKMADMAAYFDPEAFILAGGLTKAGEILLEPTRISLEKNVFSAYANKIELLVSHMSGRDAVLGAAALIWNSIE